jgi:amino acid adenylation domain-containing protein
MRASEVPPPRAEACTTDPAGAKAEGARRLPASPAQASLFFLRQVMPYPSAYNTAVRFRLSGELDAGALLGAFREIVRRHESLRTTFAVEDGAVVQMIRARATIDVTSIDVSSSPTPEAHADRLARAAAELPFDLARGPLLSVRLIRVAPREHLLCVVFDHIVMDGLSMAVLWRELGALYRASRGGAPPLPPPGRQYAQCVEAQAAWLRTSAHERQLAYWTARLSGVEAGDLPADRPRPPVRSHRGDLRVAALPAPLVAGLRALAARHEVSIFAELLAALAVLLARCAGQREAVVMVPMACRQRFLAEEVVGFFANVVVLRSEVPPEIPFVGLVRRVNAELMAGALRQDVPFERVVEALHPDRSLSHDPLARVALSFLPARAATLDLPGVTATYGEIPNGGAKFDLGFVVTEHADHLTCSVEYNSDIFDPETVEALLGRYRLVLEAGVADPSLCVADLPLLGAEERRRVLVEWNATDHAHPQDRTLTEVFEAQADATPQAVALAFEGRTLTYRALDQRANQLARVLRRHGVGPEALVGVCMHRSLELVVALCAVLKAGGAYVPLDPSFPADRLAFILADARPRVILADPDLAAGLPPSDAVVVPVSASSSAFAAEPSGRLGRAGLTLESLAYVIYTSGSTGRPKGAMNEHRGILNRLLWMQRTFGLGAGDRVIQKTPFSFDISVWELFWPLMFGARLVVARPEGHRDPRYLAELIAAQGITMAHFVPSMLRAFLEDRRAAACRSLRLVFASGEALPPALCDRFFEVLPGAALHNLYGPTEAAVEVTHWACRPGAAVVPIGRPIDNVRVYVLDEQRQPVPIGVRGELHIGGVQVGRGYLDRPELTRERFVDDPFDARPGARLYRTGDVARWLPSGDVEYLGRDDFQVKIRGFRIELGEIEAALASHPEVQQAVVVARDEGPGSLRLVAYVVPREPGAGPAIAALRAHLARRLPDHMIPSALVPLAAVPLLPNGKIDRRALPAPRTAAQGAGTFVAPRTPAEELLARVWADALGVDRVGATDDFFALGGHSLLALKLFNRIEATFSRRLPVATIFEAPTVAQMSEILQSGGWRPRWTSLVPIQTAGTRPPFFCVHGGGALVIFYHPMARHLGDDQPFYGLQPPGSVHDTECPHIRSVEAMAAHYLAEVREVQPEGPYLLGGASYGGLIALEMAQQLAAEGQETALLVMFDTYGPGYWQPPTGLGRIPHGLQEVCLRLEHHAGSVQMLAPGERVAYLRSKLDKAIEEGAEALDAWRRSLERGALTWVHRPLPPELEEMRNVVNEAVARYRPHPYAGRITLFRAHRQAPGTRADPTLGWSAIARGGVEIHPMPGYHAAMISEPRVRVLAPVLRECLRRAAGGPDLSTMAAPPAPGGHAT